MYCGRIDEHDEHEVTIPGHLEGGYGTQLVVAPPLEFTCPGQPLIEGGARAATQ